MSAYRTPAPDAKRPRKTQHPVHTLICTLHLKSGNSVKFEVETLGHYTLEYDLREFHEKIVDKWKPKDHFARPMFREGTICFSHDKKDHVINLAHVEYYTVEAIQHSDQPA